MRREQMAKRIKKMQQVETEETETETETEETETETETEETETETDGEATTIIAASSRAPGHWRAGTFWPTKPVSKDVTAAQLAQLRADKSILIYDGSDVQSADSILQERVEAAKRRRALAEEELRNRAQRDEDAERGFRR